MELVNSSNFIMNSSTGGLEVSKQPNDSNSKLETGLSDRTTFPALRSAAYDCTMQLIDAYRDAIRQLFKVAPLADHVDFKEHYLAFIELEKFDINETTEAAAKGGDITVKALKDVVQLSLIQQSEYLRRFALTFSDKVRQDKSLSKSGVLKHIRDLIGKLKLIYWDPLIS